MEYTSGNILTFESLEIGFMAGKDKRVLVPPLNAAAVKGELIAVIGKNGIGKSTLLRTIAGLQSVLSGTLNISGKDIRKYSRQELSEKVGFVSTEIVRVSNMTVYDLVSLGRFPHTNWFGKNVEEDRNAIFDSIAKAGMSDFSDRLISELSDGERQRAMIGMILAQDSPLMILDEPSAFLDIRSKFEIMNLMQELTGKNEKTIVFSSHDLATALSKADKIWLMLKDRFIEGAPEDIVLSGSLNLLFDDNSVRFNAREGSFMTKNEEHGKIMVNGDGDVKYWTERAISRAGFSVSDISPSVKVEVPGTDKPGWKCTAGDSSLIFESVYHLIHWLKHNRDLIS